MKFLVVIFAIFAFVIASAAALKDPVCGLKDSMEGDDDHNCLAYFPTFTYRAATNECVFFIYGGCGGNDNRFDSKNECEEKCKE